MYNYKVYHFSQSQWSFLIMVFQILKMFFFLILVFKIKRTAFDYIFALSNNKITIY